MSDVLPPDYDSRGTPPESPGEERAVGLFVAANTQQSGVPAPRPELSPVAESLHVMKQQAEAEEEKE